MKKLILLLALILLPSQAKAFSHIPEGTTEGILNEALQGQSLIFNRQYPKAEEYFRQLEQKYPDSALGSFGLMALVNARMFENYDFKLDREFEEIQKRNKEMVDKIAKNDQATAFDDFLCGASSGLRGFYYSRKDKLFAALGEANQAKKCLERALKRDPEFYDVNIGLGLFNFWRSVFTSRFKALPFFQDQRAEGIAQIQSAIDKGIFANDLARASLAFVYYEQNNGKLGLPITEKLLESYPPNVIMKNLKAYFLGLNHQTEASLALYDEILKNTPEITVSRYFKGLVYYRAHDYPKAQKNLLEFLDTKPTPAWQAYTHNLLGLIDLKDGKRDEAYEHFKTGSRIYGDYTANLKMLLQMRRKEK